MKKTIYLACFLGILCAIFGGAISYVNDLTAPLIAQQAMAAETAIFNELDPSASFSELDISSDTTGFVKKAYYGEGESNQYYIYNISVVGFNASSSIDYLVGFDKAGQTVLFNIVSHQETEGIGSRVATEEFSSTIIGSNVNDAISTLSGATVSSSAIINGVNAAKALYAEHAGVAVETQEIETPAISLGAKTSFTADFSQFAAECTLSETTSDGLQVFACNARGYGLIDPSGHNSETGHEYARNEANITVDPATKSVVKIEVTTFGDTEGIGDVAISEDYLKLFEGVNLESEVDTVTNATWTSNSVISMINQALSMSE